MARIPYLNQEDLSDENKRLLQRPGNLFRLLVHSPEAFRNFSRLGGWIRNGSALDPRLRELAILQVGYLTDADYEWTHHIDIGRGFGVTDDDVRAVVTETDGGGSPLGRLERLVLRAAREMTADLRVSDEAFEGLKEQLSNEHIVDLFMTIAYYNLVVRVIHSLEVDLEPEYAAILEEFPLGE
jgi:alkylhydroperoxidase family enzyme